MKENNNSVVSYLLLVIIQLVICNYLYISPLLTLSMLPALVLSIPPKIRTPWAMLIAFVTALVVDFLGDGLPGLNALALVPVALVRNPLLVAIFGPDIVEREERLSVHRDDPFRTGGALLIVTAMFLAVYIFADNAGSRPFLFNLLRFAVSLPSSFVVCLLAFNVMNPKERR